MNRDANIKDIARAAKASVSTVSRVLNNHPDASEAARKQVMRAVRVLNYRPNSRARQLVKNTTGTICLILSNREVINSFHARILVGVEKYARRLGRNLIFMRFDYSPKASPRELALPAVIWERGAIDGLVIAGTNHSNFIQAVKSLSIPFVVFGNNLTGGRMPAGLNSVGFDNEGGTGQATEYLIKLGHRAIWCLADINLPWYRRCYNGYLRAMRSHGFKPRRLNLALQSSAFNYGKECAERIVALREPVSAIVAGDDEIALGILSVLNPKGIRVPQDMSVVGFDDVEELKYLYPPLTTIRVNREQVGEELAKLLFEVIENPHNAPIKRVMPTQLVVRKSCAEPGGRALAARRAVARKSGTVTGK